MIADKQLEVDFVQQALALGEESPGRFNAETSKESISESCFTDSFLWRAYQASRDLTRRGERLDSVLLAATLGPDARDRVHALWPAVPRVGGLQVLASRLKDYAARRAADDIGRRIQEAARDGSQAVGQSLVKAAAALQQSYSPDGSGVVSGADVLARFYDEWEKNQEGTSKNVIETGIGPLDEACGGLPRNFISIVGAYPGCFKSGIMGTVAANLSVMGRKVGFFSLEDNPTWLAKRFTSRATGIPVEDISRGRSLSLEEKKRVAQTQDRVINAMSNIVFDGRSGLTGWDVASSARYMIAERGVEVVIIDHIGEVATPVNERRKERHDLDVASNVRAIRDVAKDTGISVLMAAHLRRKGDGEEDIYRVPTMTDFSDSSAIEKMCRLAFGLYQPEDRPDHVAMKVLKMNEGGARGNTIYLKKSPACAMVQNT